MKEFIEALKDSELLRSLIAVLIAILVYSLFKIVTLHKKEYC